MTSLTRLICVFVCLSVCVLSFAQDKPKRITITRTDGKTLAGELVEATPAGVTVKPNAKSDPIMTPWQDIKSVGGGLSREKIVEEWRHTKADQLCNSCKGSATTQCSECRGTAVDPAQATKCEACSGTGSIGPCKTPRCVDGQIACPDKCLKAESFSGKPDAEGKRWRRFKGKNGELKVSDGHVGSRVMMIDGNPTLESTPCPTCGGTTRIPDPACKGTGKQLCKECKGHGVVGPACAKCKNGLVPCEVCKATGLKSAATPADPATPPADAATPPAEVTPPATPPAETPKAPVDPNDPTTHGQPTEPGAAP